MNDHHIAHATPHRIRVLQVEDSLPDAELALAELEADGIVCEARVVDDERAYIAELQAFDPHIVLSDLSLPGFSGQRALELLRERSDDLPFIYVSATLGEEAAVEALRNGATDYILKQNPARLASAVRRALSEVEARRARRHAEAELIRAQRFESLAMLAGGLSHDLRNMLQPLLLAGDSLQDYQDDPRLARLGALVRDCGRRGLEMVQSMLSFARGARRAEQVRLGDLLDALGLLLQGSVPRSVHLVIGMHDPELHFEGNHTELQQCLLNLSLNAIQAMPGGGELHINTEKVALSAEFFAEGEEVRPGQGLCLTVSDTGAGMSEEVLSHLFEPFYTTKQDGTGLGLLSCQRIVTSHGGVMRVDSKPGVGTRFRIYIPLAQSTSDVGAGEEAGNLQGSAEHVLVVAEEVALLSLLRDTLDAWGYQVHVSQSGTAALQWIEASGLPDLVLMDADMSLFPAERTLAELLQRGYAGGVVMLTGASGSPVPVAGSRLQVLMLDKPFSTQRLLQGLKQVLSRGHGDGARSADTE
ncbi:response regulator [Dyella sp. A6]|uniref:hybrid sensor histidine kinase/response regulator n=1 Tax=Dyella aluminiiresistens TaxID=3069105 RepID=UPI002E79AF72|nr:response regulator [Dyella sp. A6]